ncbi:hypothetical protein C1I98_10750 [Spongiactinospora gelatinilytica]|uniref:Uncharacterized protein n=2 Tax=Spongiactinospora TaxID=2871671 RepID=A0A2W2GQX9_9ACTN|nr:hypothetical protein [Spongiactinospora gelatinilytica]PZG50352.1 hypothetical protein C1I98_10750 [Spongiactinospora gelatinilytica]
MAERVQYYAMVLLLGPGDRDGPAGLARRRVRQNGVAVDEAIHRDLKWHPTGKIRAWERGDVAGDLIEISQEEAERIMVRFREQFGGEGTSDPRAPKARRRLRRPPGTATWPRRPGATRAAR